MAGYSERIALAALEGKAIELRTDPPVVWASGYRMPIYNDNRLFLRSAGSRLLIAEAFVDSLQRLQIDYDLIAGTSTAGISPATTLADKLGCGLVYVRDKPKDHGLRNQIEGIRAEDGLEGRTVILIEDLVSTGGSSVAAVQAIRDAGGVCNHCLSIFTYGFDKADKMFAGVEPFDKEETKKLETPCVLTPSLDYDTLISIAKDTGYIDEVQAKLLAEWRKDPFGWGEKRGYPRVVSKVEKK